MRGCDGLKLFQMNAERPIHRFPEWDRIGAVERNTGGVPGEEG